MGGFSFVNCPLKPWPLFAYTLYSTCRALKESAKKASIMRIARFCCQWGQEFHRKKRKLGCLNFAGYSQQHCLFLTILQTPRKLIKDHMLIDQANFWLNCPGLNLHVFLGRPRPFLHAILLHYVWCYSNCAL